MHVVINPVFSLTSCAEWLFLIVIVAETTLLLFLCIEKGGLQKCKCSRLISVLVTGQYAYLTRLSRILKSTEALVPL